MPFYTVTQNNSQGVFDHDATHGIGYALCVEVSNYKEALERMQAIVDGYDQGPYCPCCGERWSFYLYEDDGTEEPELYEEPLKGEWGIPSYIHYADGRIEERK